MEEPSRIGLTASTSAQLDELLESLNPEPGCEGIKLIKFDLYRLAVALGLKNQAPPPLLSDKSISNFRVNELDPDGVLFLAVESSELLPKDCTVYEFIERLAEREIGRFYQDLQQTGQLSLDQYFEE